MFKGIIKGAATLSIALISFSADAQPAKNPLPEASQPADGHGSVAETLKEVRSKAGVVFTTENGWLIATDKAAYTIWSFAPQGYPSYPAVVKRQAIPQGNGSVVQMEVDCGATKEACDDLVRTFAQMNGLPLHQ